MPFKSGRFSLRRASRPRVAILTAMTDEEYRPSPAGPKKAVRFDRTKDLVYDLPPKGEKTSEMLRRVLTSDLEALGVVDPTMQTRIFHLVLSRYNYLPRHLAEGDDRLTHLYPLLFRAMVDVPECRCADEGTRK